MTNGQAIKRNNALLDQFHPVTLGMPQGLFSEVDSLILSRSNAIKCSADSLVLFGNAWGIIATFCLPVMSQGLVFIH